MLVAVVGRLIHLRPARRNRVLPLLLSRPVRRRGARLNLGALFATVALPRCFDQPRRDHLTRSRHIAMRRQWCLKPLQPINSKETWGACFTHRLTLDRAKWLILSPYSALESIARRVVEREFIEIPLRDSMTILTFMGSHLRPGHWILGTIPISGYSEIWLNISPALWPPKPKL